MSLINSTEFNTNSACAGVGPTERVQDPYRTTQLVIFTMIATFMIGTSIFFIWRRKNRRRLSKRSIVPLFFGSFVCTIFLMIRTYYNYVGKEYFPCALSAVIYYLSVPYMSGADMFLLVRYLHSISVRRDVSEDTLKQVVADKQTTTDHLGAATAKTWLIGLFNYLLLVVELYLPPGNNVSVKYMIREEKFRSISKSRMVTYEVVSLSILGLPYYLAAAVRISTEPSLMHENACTGCGVLLTDWLVIFFLFFLYVPPILSFTYRHRDVPDALLYRRDAKIAAVVGGPIGVIGSILALVDPGEVMKSQKFDWFTFEMLSIFYFHCTRCVLQLWRTARIHKLGEQNVQLIEVLQDPKGSILFEKHLMSELANENLLFWREAIKYKLSYTKNPDFEYTQQLAKVLYRTFIGRHAQLPINISDDLARSIETRIRGTASRNLYDDAIIEVYRLLEGPFRRFIHSPVFKKYAANKADFSMPTMSAAANPLAIVPSMGEEDGPSFARFNIDEYVHSL